MKSILNLRKVATIVACLAATTFGAQAQTWPPAGMNGNGAYDNPWQITTAAHLKALADYVNAGNGNATYLVYYKLMNDIDLSAYGSGEGWKPIGDNHTGDDNTRFLGYFSGNGKVIRNLKINRPTQDYVGLFGYMNGSGSIGGLGLENCHIIGQHNVGGLTGYSVWFGITDCYVTGDTVRGRQYVGGLTGWIRGNITNAQTAITTKGTMYVGGLAGMTSDVDIRNCSATGNVIGISGQDSYTGGLIGQNMLTMYGTARKTSGCFASGNVEGGNYTGGLIGYNAYQSIVQDCYATGNVTGILGYYIGGFTGFNNGKINTCYASGNVQGRSIIGGFTGHNYAGSTIDNSIAANGIIKATDNTNVNRIAGTNDGYTRCNYTCATVLTNNDNPVSITDGLNTEAGESKTMDTLKTLNFYLDAEWYMVAYWMNYGYTIWKICDGEGLPFFQWQNINCVSSNVELTQDNAEIKIYPNPVKDELRIENGEWRIENVEILDLSGKIILNSQFSTLNSINVYSLPQGIYFVKITTDKGVVTKKFIKN